MPDPAEVARERAERVQRLLKSAEELESDPYVGKPISDLAVATNLRVQAICEHLNLRVREEDGDVD